MAQKTKSETHNIASISAQIMGARLFFFFLTSFSTLSSLINFTNLTGTVYLQSEVPFSVQKKKKKKKKKKLKIDKSVLISTHFDNFSRPEK